MNVLISGGCKNGKTGFAQRIAMRLSQGGKRYYVATMVPCDGEDRARIVRHIDEREGLGFETFEIGHDISRCIDAADEKATFLIDSVTALLANEMFSVENFTVDSLAAGRCREGLLKITERAENAVFVTDYIYSDAFVYDALTEQYRRALAHIDRSLAAACDTVIELCAGNVIYHKGMMPL